jgi:hypothetical protein
MANQTDMPSPTMIEQAIARTYLLRRWVPSAGRGSDIATELKSPASTRICIPRPKVPGISRCFLG